jgi:hypothetical protein
VLREGTVVGLIGAAVLMAWFFVADLVAGVPLRTPGLLGTALFDGAPPSSATASSARVVVGYTAVHLAGFVALGVALAGLFALAQREKRVLALIFLLGSCLAVVFLAVACVLWQWVDQAVTVGTFVAGHVLAAAAIVAGLAYFHDGLLRRLPEALDGE